jgi:hypothetical protein
VVQLASDSLPLGVFDDGSVRRVSNDSPSGPTASPFDFGGPVTFLSGSENDGTACVILRAGGTACSAPSLVPSGASSVSLAITDYDHHACGLDASGAVTCWSMGDTNAYGLESHPEWQVAAGTYRIPLGQPAIAIGAGDWTACAMLADGTVKCWAMDDTADSDPALGGSVATATGISAVDLGPRPAP